MTATIGRLEIVTPYQSQSAKPAKGAQLSNMVVSRLADQARLTAQGAKARRVSSTEGQPGVADLTPLRELLTELSFERRKVTLSSGKESDFYIDCKRTALTAEGRSNQGIAARLVVTEHAVEKHIRNIFGKLHIDSGPEDHRRVLAVLTFLRSSAST